MRLRLFSPLALILIASSAYAVTGTWSGNLSGTVACDNGSQLSISGPVTASGLAFDSHFFMSAAVTAAIPDVEACAAGPVAQIPFFLSGDLNGNSVAGDLILPTNEIFEFSGSLSGETLTITAVGDAGGRGTLTLNRTSTQMPDTRYSATYGGTYNYSENFSSECNNVGVVTASGGVSATLIHIGAGALSVLELSNFKLVLPTGGGGCTVVDFPDFPVLLLGNINGSSFTGFVGSEDFAPFIGSISTSGFSGSAIEAGARFDFMLNRTSSIPPPEIRSFTATPPSVAPGQPSTLAWTTEHADTVSLDNGLGAQPVNGSLTVRPNATTVYTLTATGLGGSTQGKLTITISAPEPSVVIGSAPRGFVQPAGVGGGTDAFTISNIGDASTTVTLSPSGAFFTIAPTTFTLGPRQNQTVIITGLPQAAGSYEGTIAATGAGVPANAIIPVRMLSAAPPTGTVQPRPTTARVEVSSTAGQNATGSVEFTNTGNSTVQAIAVADQPWIIPQSGIITIAPGQTVSVSYTIDSSKRPDSAAPLGAAVGKISLVFIGGAPTGPTLAADGPSTSTISVTLVHVAKPNVAAGTPAPLAAGELALFVSGLGNKPTAVGDLLLANKQSTPLTGLQLFVQGTGVQPLSTNISQLVPNSSVAFSGLLKNVFNTAVPTGTAQVRGTDVSRVSVAAVQSNTSSPAGTYSTALPVFRSDRSVSPSVAIMLSALSKGTTSRTDLFVQETSGIAGNFQIDFLDSAGRVVSSRPSEAIAAFGFAELSDVAPANATAARVANASASSRISAYGLVTNPTTGDGWLVTDAAAGTTETQFIVPIFSAGTGASTVLYTTNRSNVPANVTVDVRSAGMSRRRAAGRGTSTPPLTQVSDATTTLAPSETTSTTITPTTGYIRVTGPAGAISAAARSVRTTGTTAFGSGLPAVPVSASLGTGQNKRFASIDDASTASRTGSVPATFRTSLALVETNNQSAVVRVTLQFAFSGGSLVSSTARVTKDYTVSAGQFVLITDLARDVIGTSRDQFGDLRNITMDVEVASGSGKVIPFVQSVDNGSGDMIVRIE